MRTSEWNGLKLSQLMLGTVQFGLDYGIANRAGKPDFETVRTILECAFEGGVNCLDTAAAYGDSEAVLGRALEELGMRERVVVVSKIRPLPDDLTPREADAAIEASVTDSLRHLRLQKLQVCLFHRENNVRYLDSLQRLQDRGMVDYIGVSALSISGARRAMADLRLNVLQIPGNILDRRFLSDIPATALQRGAAVFVRSVFLQGLLLMPEADIMPELSEVIPIRRRLRQIADDAGLTLAELVVRAVLSHRGVTCALVGVDTEEQMRCNLAAFGGDDLEPDLMTAIEAAVPQLPDAILNPFRWPPRPRADD